MSVLTKLLDGIPVNELSEGDFKVVAEFIAILPNQ